VQPQVLVSVILLQGLLYSGWPLALQPGQHWAIILAEGLMLTDKKLVPVITFIELNGFYFAAPASDYNPIFNK
jgi:hypothetical protein